MPFAAAVSVPNFACIRNGLAFLFELPLEGGGGFGVGGTKSSPAPKPPLSSGDNDGGGGGGGSWEGINTMYITSTKMAKAM